MVKVKFYKDRVWITKGFNDIAMSIQEAKDLTEELYARLVKLDEE